MTSEPSVPSTFRAFTAGKNADGTYSRAVRRVDGSFLGEGDLVVRVLWSSINYKDALAASANERVARIDPIIPGIDLAAEVVGSTSPSFAAGDLILAHGYDFGVARHGGFAEYTRIPASKAVRIPAGLTARQAMIIGTAGFTAALSIDALEKHGMAPDEGDVLVTGATGGVGSVAVAMLAARGYRVVASTGKGDEATWLTSLGAAQIMPRIQRDDPPKPLGAERWNGVVDCVGGAPLIQAIAEVKYGHAAAISGLTAGAGLNATVFPFILRSVALLGIDSVGVDIDRRRAVWDRIAEDLRPSDVDVLCRQEVGLDGISLALDKIRAGRAVGRTIVALA